MNELVRNPLDFQGLMIYYFKILNYDIKDGNPVVCNNGAKIEINFTW